jgi:hypothetical protein
MLTCIKVKTKNVIFMVILRRENFTHNILEVKLFLQFHLLHHKYLSRILDTNSDERTLFCFFYCMTNCCCTVDQVLGILKVEL